MNEASTKLDPRWDWIEVTSFGSASPEYIKGLCRHTEVIPVDSVDGETVAHLCLTCDGQLPQDWMPRDPSQSQTAL